jgi:hypothetical protein
VATDDSTGIAAEATRWQKEIESALAQAPDSERHDWAVRELIARLRGDPESDADLWAWASRALDTAARKANVGVDEAARLAQAYRSVPESSKAAPVFAAAAAAGWTNDARQAPFLESIPVGERADVHAQLLRTLDHRPSSGFTDHVIRLVRETTDDALLRSVFDEDRAAAAAAAPDRGRDVVLAYADRLADARLADGHRRKGYFALGMAALRAPAEGAAALRRLADTARAEDNWPERLRNGADLIESGKATERDLKRLLD